MRFTVRDGLPFVAITVRHRGKRVRITDVLIDTGSAGTLLSADALHSIGVEYEPFDPIHRIAGIGGSEFVFTKVIDEIAIARMVVPRMEIEVGAVDYGFDINGIVGTDYLLRIGCVLDFKARTITSRLFHRKPPN